MGRVRSALAADLNRAKVAAKVAGAVIRVLGKIDKLVNSAGGYRLITSNHAHRISIVDTAENKWRRVLDSDLITAFLTCKTALPQKTERSTGVNIGLASRNMGLFVRSVVLSLRCGWGLRDPHAEFEPT